MWGADLCEQCARAVGKNWQEVAAHAPYLTQVDPESGAIQPMFPCFALAEYGGRVRQLIVEWKHSTVQGLDSSIVGLWREAVQALRRSKEFQEIMCAVAGEPLCVVPAPSRWQRRHAGQLVAAKLAVGAARDLEAPVIDVLRTRRLRPRLPQWGRLSKRRYAVANFSERAKKRFGIRCVSDMRGWNVIIVDDVVTTGATASGAAMAVERCGGTVVAMLALAAPRATRRAPGLIQGVPSL